MSSAAATEAEPCAPAGRWERATSAATFLVPALALWLPSGYSWGALLLLLLALGNLYHWPRTLPRLDAGSWLLAATILVMGLMWALQGDAQAGAARWDRFSKYALALPCLGYALAHPPSAQALEKGLLAGCLGAGGIALWQVYGLGMARAAGHTNAIQFGNLALLLAVLAGIVLACHYQRLRPGMRLGLVLAIGAAFGASVLSLTRGGWLALLLLPLLAWPLLRRPGRQPTRVGRPARLARPWVALLLVLLIPLAASLPQVVQRLQLMGSEVAAYQTQGNASTSIGHRLEHWRLAWHMGRQKPWLGWGDAGYKQEKLRLTQAGQFDINTTYFDHAHNEVLDVFSKRGLLGVALLLAFYGVPLALFWPSRRRQAALQTTAAPAWLQAQWWALRLMGSAIALMYIGFGWTQVFFAHNSGTMFYLFMLMLCWAALRRLEQRA
ncbi:O-antigen ligase domain-containing protein [Vandammella animalimorsus]|uniref:O-antigen ligase domain-containing protein n=1 Tax=Vandammella animalimorsus TaxID=2029117 RepID=A0A3M6RSN5_9BURK|nr:O-antigen ligase family protein [Vandammella animalimorsus]RMX18469.1 O-antigen ligase domain-containing protein [Vandammella animalimorsus]